jgi:PAS domain S-box-containing protein
LTIPETEIEASLQQTRLRLHRSSLASSLAASATVASALALVLHFGDAAPPLAAWLAGLGLAWVLRAALGRAQARDPDAPRRAVTWLRRHRAAFALHGLAWAAVVPLLHPSPQWLPLPAGDESGQLVALALTAISAASLIAAAFDLVAAFAFAVPVVLSLVVCQLRLPHGVAQGTLSGVLLALALLAALRNQRLLRKGIRLELTDTARARAAALDAASAQHAHLRLADQHQLLMQLMQTTTQGFWFLDNDGRTTDLNPAMARLLGRPRADVLGRHVFDFFAGADLQRLQAEFELRRQGRSGGYEISLSQPDGTLVHCVNNATPLFDSHGVRVGSVGVFTDITVHRESATALRTYERVVNSVRELVSVIDQDEVYRVVNDAWCRAAGRAREDVVGRTGREFVSEGQPARRQALEQAMATRQPQRARGVGGLPGLAGRILETTYYPFVGDDAGRLRVGIVTRDITGHEEALVALTAARDEAERANRAKSQFLSQMSHELRTPLNAILGFGQLLDTATEPALVPLQRAQVQEILRGARHLLALINEMLDLGRIEAGKLRLEPEVLSLQALVEECQALVHTLAQERGIRLRSGGAGLPGTRVAADRTRLKQVLLNLLGNAIKYNRPGGEVSVSCRDDGRWIELAVHDSGHGLSAEQRARLFEPFERLDAAQTGIEGTGIGLALSRRLMEAMGGSMGVESEPGVGSSFWLRLPRADAAAGSAPAEVDAAAPARHEAAPPPPQAVLYIEDNPVNVVLMEAMLARLPGVRMFSAPLPEAGLTLALDERPALLLLDIQLPGMSGLELLARLRSDPRTRHIPAVAVSANALPEDIAKAMAAGFQAYVTKPLELAPLLATVKSLLPALQAGSPESK